MWRTCLVLLTLCTVCQFATENPPQSTIEAQTVTPFYALSTGLIPVPKDPGAPEVTEIPDVAKNPEVPEIPADQAAPAPIMLRLGNSTIDSTKSFKVPQQRESNEVTESSTSTSKTAEVTKLNAEKIMSVVPHVVSVKNTYFDHDRKYGPTFEDSGNGNVSRITVQLGEDANLNCRISLLQDKTVSWVRRRGRDEMPELLTVGAVTYAADNRVTVARRYPGNWRLLIREVRPDDEGVYECQISTHPPRVSRTYLHINSPQVWVVDEAGAPLLEKYYEAESTLALVCRARDVETPALLTWLHEGRALNADTTRGGINVKTEQKPNGADSLLRLARVNSSDAGNYTCAVRGARPHTVAVHVLNEESLAELHAGGSQSSLTTVSAMLVTLSLITDRQPLPSVSNVALAATIFSLTRLVWEYVSVLSFSIS